MLTSKNEDILESVIECINNLASGVEKVPIRPRPTALEVAILDVAIQQYPEPIYGYDVRRELVEARIIDRSKNVSGLYRALGRCTTNGWLEHVEIPIISKKGPERKLYKITDMTVSAWFFGIRCLMSSAVDLNVGRGRRT